MITSTSNLESRRAAAARQLTAAEHHRGDYALIHGTTETEAGQALEANVARAAKTLRTITDEIAAEQAAAERGARRVKLVPAYQKRIAEFANRTSAVIKEQDRLRIEGEALAADLQRDFGRGVVVSGATGLFEAPFRGKRILWLTRFWFLPSKAPWQSRLREWAALVQECGR